MIVFEANILALVILVMTIIITILYGSRAYWKARAEVLEENDSQSGWRSEALYLRHRANKTAAEFAEYN